jgi:hypothetical protein
MDHQLVEGVEIALLGTGNERLLVHAMNLPCCLEPCVLVCVHVFTIRRHFFFRQEPRVRLSIGLHWLAMTWPCQVRPPMVNQG